MPVIAGTGSAVVGGFYLAFSAVVMPALRDRQANEACTAMIAINEAALRPTFMTMFFGTAAACGGTAFAAILEPQPQTPLQMIGSVAYLVGWTSTMAINVPLNNRLARHGTSEGDGRWLDYAQRWTTANHLRTVLSLAGAAALLFPTLTRSN
ncbi:putative membrane protein [Arthrobacter sp. CAN_A6]